MAEGGRYDVIREHIKKLLSKVSRFQDATTKEQISSPKQSNGKATAFDGCLSILSKYLWIFFPVFFFLFLLFFSPFLYDNVATASTRSNILWMGANTPEVKSDRRRDRVYQQYLPMRGGNTKPIDRVSGNAKKKKKSYSMASGTPRNICKCYRMV
ncbi:hypothetical protein TWF569_001241 [Orbilia oligospora]|nr:hypothetical protein TWF569_001241 [Orbilia oligospora]